MDAQWFVTLQQRSESDYPHQRSPSLPLSIWTPTQWCRSLRRQAGSPRKTHCHLTPNVTNRWNAFRERFRKSKRRGETKYARPTHRLPKNGLLVMSHCWSWHSLASIVIEEGFSGITGCPVMGREDIRKDSLVLPTILSTHNRTLFIILVILIAN